MALGGPRSNPFQIPQLGRLDVGEQLASSIHTLECWLPGHQKTKLGDAHPSHLEGSLFNADSLVLGGARQAELASEVQEARIGLRNHSLQKSSKLMRSYRLRGNWCRSTTKSMAHERNLRLGLALAPSRRRCRANSSRDCAREAPELSTHHHKTV